MGLLLSILFSYVGAVELMFVVRDIVHKISLHHDQLKLIRTLSGTTSPSSSLHDLQENLRKTIKSAQERLCENDSIQLMADGVQYEQGYRIPNADEQDISKRWLEARASLTIEPSHDLNTNHLESNCIESTTNDEQSDDTLSKGDSLRSSSLSVKTVIENQKIDNQFENNDFNYEENVDDNDEDDEELPSIYFDEYSDDYPHALDGVTKKIARKNNDEPRRRKSYKMFTGGHSGGDILQRRRSEDIDGETDNPWGELKPENFHDHSLWNRERTMSIAENEEMKAFVDGKSHQENSKRETKPLNSTSITDDDEDDNDNPTSNGNKTVRIILYYFYR